MTTTFRHFKSIEEYANLESNPVNIGKDYSYGGAAWFGVGSRNEALAISKAGVWQAGFERMENEMGRFDAPVASAVKRQQVWSDQGDSIDIHRVYKGDLATAWRRTKRQQHRANKNIVIAFPLMISAGTRPDDLFYCGIAALKLTEALSLAGYTVTLLGVHGTTSKTGAHTCFQSLEVKSASAPLDLQALITAVCFTGFVRTAGFKAITANKFAVSTGLGQAHYDPVEPLDDLGFTRENVIRGLFRVVTDLESAKRWVEEQIAKLEVTND